MRFARGTLLKERYGRGTSNLLSEARSAGTAVRMPKLLLKCGKGLRGSEGLSVNYDEAVCLSLKAETGLSQFQRCSHFEELGIEYARLALRNEICFPYFIAS